MTDFEANVEPQQSQGEITNVETTSAVTTSAETHGKSQQLEGKMIDVEANVEPQQLEGKITNVEVHDEPKKSED
jgi:hypothetical protein